MSNDKDIRDEIDMNADVDLEIKVSNGWWSITRLTAENAQKVITYAGNLTGESQLSTERKNV